MDCLYYGLDNVSRELLRRVCRNPPWIELAPLDKGLSGSIVLMGRWSVGGTTTKFHVFKIGDLRKLRKEHDAICTIAAPLVRHFPHADYEALPESGRAVLSHEFMGETNGSTRSLRQFIDGAQDPSEVEGILDRLYTERIVDWRPNNVKEPTLVTIRGEFADWSHKGNLNKAVIDVGDFIHGSLERAYGLNIDGLKHLIEMTFDSTATVDKGPVHGDLHSQNVLVDEHGRISLIDFGWTGIRWRAIDYIWLECSLKFVVSSPYATLADLIAMEESLDARWDRSGPYDPSILKGRLQDRSLMKIAAGLSAVRRLARTHLPSLTLEDYRKGLVAMSYALTTFPQLNQVFLLHSIARNALAIRDTVRPEGPYHKLYTPSSLLWPSRPGRMVKKAVSAAPAAGRALDVGCGDGKNIVYLEDAGWHVTAFDINRVAVANVAYRAVQHFGANHIMRGTVSVADATVFEYPEGLFDLVVAYGLYHCLNDDDMVRVHQGIVRSLRSGGLLAFATLNDTEPIPDGHGTGELYLRGSDFIFDLTEKEFVVVDSEVGYVVESHPPYVAEHRHGVTWALLQRR